MTLPIRPPALAAGDVVGVVAPSSPVMADRLSAGVHVLERWGLRVRVGDHVLARAHDDILAGSDDQRARDLEQAWTAPDVRAVFCARGGYGAERLIDHLDWTAMAAAGPKVLVGSSDVTALHTVWGRRLGLVTLFGPMTASELFAGDGADEPSREFLRDLLFTPATVDRVVAEGPCPATRADLGQAVRGRLVGGTLSLVAAAIGTPDSTPARSAVAFLEDVGEQPYRIDRLLTQLLRSGWFDAVRGVALGSFHDCGDVAAVVEDRLGPLGIPVVAGFPVGHGHRQLTLPLGLDVELVPRRGELRFSRPPLAPRH